MKKTRKIFWITIVFYMISFVELLVMISYPIGGINPLFIFIAQIAVIGVIGCILVHKAENKEDKEASCN